MNSSLFSIKVLSVSLKLKFKCKMRLQLKDGTSSQQVHPQNSVYTFDQILKVNSKHQTIELNILIITEKGSQYNGGVVKINSQQAQSSSNLPLHLPISKCIDKQAWCQLLIIKKSNQKNAKNDKSPNRENQQIQHQAKTGSTKFKKSLNYAVQSNLGETQSEYCSPLPNSAFENLKLQSNLLFQQAPPKRHLFGQHSRIRTSRPSYLRESPHNHSAPRDNSPEIIDFKQKVKEAMDSAQFQSMRVKKMEQRLAKESKKLQDQQNHRKLIENSQQAYKIQVIKLQTLKNELEKEIKKKDSKIKDLTVQATRAKQLQRNLGQARQELKKVRTENELLKHKIQRSGNMLHQTMDTVQIEKAKYEQQIATLKTRIEASQREQQKLKQKSYLMSQNTESQLQNTHSQLNQLALELQKIKKKRVEQDANWKEKILESQKSIALLKKELKKQKEQHQQEKNQLQSQLQALSNEVTKSKSELEKEKIAYFKVLTEKRLAQNDKQELSSKLNEAKRFNEKQQSIHKELTSEKNSIIEQNSKLKRKIQQLIDDIKKAQKSKKEEIQKLSKQLIQSNQKCRQLEKRLQQMEYQMRQVKSACDKNERNLVNLQKQNSSLQEKDKQMKTLLSRKQAQILKLRQDFQDLLKKSQLKNSGSKMYSNSQMYSKEQIQYHLQNQKLLGVYETQVKYLELQVNNQRYQISQLKDLNSKLKIINDQHHNQQYQWREQQRLWQIQKQQLKSAATHWQRQNKEIQKKLNQQQHQASLLVEQYEKEKKNHKLDNQKITTLQSNLKKTQDQKESLLGEKKTVVQNLHLLQNELSVLKGELDYYQAERKKYVKGNQELQFQLRKAKEQINQLNEKKEYEQERHNEENKRLREELVKYQNRLKIAKGQSDKFKDSLRNIIIENLINGQKSANRGQEISSSNQKRKDDKYGLTLTNQLLFKLQQHLKELVKGHIQMEGKLAQTQKQLCSARQQAILRTNQAQNIETQLKIQLEELIQNTQKLKGLSEQRETQLKKNLQQTEWQRNRLLQELKSINQVKQHLSNDLTKRQETLAEVQQKNKEQFYKIKSQLKQLQQKCLEISEQLELTQNYCFKLQEEVAEYRKSEQLSLKDKENYIKKTQELSSELQQSKANITNLLKIKTQSRQTIILYESQIQEYKIFNQQYKRQIEQYQTVKIQESGMIRSLIKQKENILHEYLKSQQNLINLQSKQYELINNIKAFQQENSHLLASLEQYRSNNKLLDTELKRLEKDLYQKEQLLITQQQEKKVSKTQITQKVFSLQQKLTQISHQLVEKVKQNEKLSAQLNQSLIETKKLQRKMVQTLQNNKWLDQNLRKQNQINVKNQSTITKLTQNLKKIQENHSQLKIDLETSQKQLFAAKSLIQTLNYELSQKDLCNFQLSSQKYKLEAQLNRLQNERQQERIELQDKISSQDAALSKLEQVCQEYEYKIEEGKRQIERMNLNILEIQHQRQLQKTKYQEKFRLSQEEKDQLQAKCYRIEKELENYKDTIFKTRSQLNAQELRAHEKLQYLEEKLALKAYEIERLKKQNQTISQLHKKSQERVKVTELRLQQQTMKLKIQTQNIRKSEQNLKLIKQDFAQTTWNCERQVRKIIKSKARLVNKGEGEQEYNQNLLKNLQESVVQVLKRFKPQ